MTTAVSPSDGRGPLVLGYVRFDRARLGEEFVLEDGRRARVEAVAGA